MEADSTTYENSKSLNDDCFPFAVSAENLKLYQDFVENNGEKHIEHQLVERLQSFGLLPNSVPCLSDNSECKVVRKAARVIDKVQWYCKGCKKRQPIRTRSFFMRLQCSLLQSLQMILAWCEDADCTAAAEHFNVKPRVAALIYDRLDDLAAREQSKYQLGGEDSVVLAELYPDCLHRLSPDTTDQPHVHRILMLADTNHIPTHYQLHVIRDDLKKNVLNDSTDSQALKAEIEEAMSRLVLPSSTVVASDALSIDGAHSMQQLFRHTDNHMRQFLSTRIWRQAAALCAAARELCAGAARRYLPAALCRLRHRRGFYRHVLRALAAHYTDSCSDSGA